MEQEFPVYSSGLVFQEQLSVEKGVPVFPMGMFQREIHLPLLVTHP